MRVCQKSQVVRPEGAEAPSSGLCEIWAFSPHCLSFDTLAFSPTYQAQAQARDTPRSLSACHLSMATEH